MTRMLLVAVVMLASVNRPVYGRQPVYFTDPNLRRAVQTQLRIRDPNAAEMLELTSLSLRPPKAQVHDLTGLQYAKNLDALLIGRPKTILWPSIKKLYQRSLAIVAAY